MAVLYCVTKLLTLTLSTSVPLRIPPSMSKGTLWPMALRTEAIMSRGAGLQAEARLVSTRAIWIVAYIVA